MKKHSKIISFFMMCIMVLGVVFGNYQTVEAATKVTSITSGSTYVIVSGGYALTASEDGYGGYEVTGTAYTDDMTVTADMKWLITSSGSGYTVFNEATSTYLSYTSSSNTYSAILSSTSKTWSFNSSYGLYQSVTTNNGGMGGHGGMGGTTTSSYYLRYSSSSWSLSTSTSITNALYVTTAPEAAVYIPFSVNLFNYYTNETDDTDTINASIKALNTDGIQFNTGGGSGINAWTGYGAGPYDGIVKSTLDEDGNLQFNTSENGISYDPVGILKPNVAVTGKSEYQGVQLPFKYANGYYTFDSEDYDVYFDGTPASGATLVVNENQKTMTYNQNITVWNGASTSTGSGTGFFPFDGAGDTTPDYHFGMTFSTEFFMTTNGYIDGDDEGEPITFEFSGDDDVWVFVDGKLVLDLGGIHDKVSGKIDFVNGTSQVYYRKVTDGTGIKEDAQDLWELLGTTAATWRSSTTPHTLQVFYLERGKGGANCKIKFNLPQKNCISLTKVMGNDVNEQSRLDKLNELSFTFTAYKKANASAEAEPLANQIYYLYDSSGNLQGGYRTDASGKLPLKFGQTARFYMDADLYADTDSDYVYFVEDNTIAMDSVVWNTYANNVAGESKTISGDETDELRVSPELEIAKMTEESSQTSAIKIYAFTCNNTVASPHAYDDVVVLDYGKPVLIDVLKNDAIFSSDTVISGLMAVENTDIDVDGDSGEGTVAEGTFTTSIALNNGTAAVTTEKDKVLYTPNKYMDSVDRFDYKVASSSTVSDDTATVQVIPATSVYYEDNFATTASDGSSNTLITFSDGFSTVTAGEAADEYQSDANKVYGYDVSYDENYSYSDGSATAIGKGATASFTFNGTGVDIYTMTDTASPVVIGNVYKVTTDSEGNVTETLKKAIIVDNTYDAGTLYQIPTICFDMGTYGTYRVELRVSTSSAEGATYYLDAIRIYNPIDTTAETEDAVDAENAYQAAGEADAVVTEVRDLLLEAEALTDNSSANGVVYLDNNTAGTSKIADYTIDGPKNEVYLSKGNGVAFTISGYDDTQKVYLGLKAPEGTASQVTVTDGTSVKTIAVTSATDMYYEITPTSAGQVVINNSGDGLLSVTKIRVTNVPQSAEAVATALFLVDEETVAYTEAFSVMSLRASESTDGSVSDGDEETGEDTEGSGEEVVEPETPDIDIDINNPDTEDEKPAGPSASQQEQIINLIKNIVSGFMKLFGRR